MSPAFPSLFSPLTLRHKRLRSRLVFGADTANMAVMANFEGRQLAQRL